jgi:hypothetical protein
MVLTLTPILKAAGSAAVATTAAFVVTGAVPDVSFDGELAEPQAARKQSNGAASSVLPKLIDVLPCADAEIKPAL